MAEFDYKQRPSTTEYRSNWDRLFSPSLKHNPEPPTTVDGSGQWLSPLDGDSGLPFSLARHLDTLPVCSCVFDCSNVCDIHGLVERVPVIPARPFLTPYLKPLSPLQHALVGLSGVVVFMIGACAFCGRAY